MTGRNAVAQLREIDDALEAIQAPGADGESLNPLAISGRGDNEKSPQKSPSLRLVAQGQSPKSLK